MKTGEKGQAGEKGNVSRFLEKQKNLFSDQGALRERRKGAREEEGRRKGAHAELTKIKLPVGPSSH